MASRWPKLVDDDSLGGDGPSTTIDLEVVSTTAGGVAVANDGGTPGDPSDDTIDFAPDPDFFGTVTVVYEICDRDGDCDTADLIITVTPVDDFPVAVDDTETVAEDTPITIDATANDTDIDGDLDPTSVTIDSQPTNGTVVVNGYGTITYIPDADFFGTDTFTYTVCDDTGLCDVGTVTVEVLPVNDPPLAVDDEAVAQPDGTAVMDVLGNDTDSDGDDLVIEGFTQPANGTVADNGDGTLTYASDSGFTGIEAFTYTVCDPDGACDTATVTVNSTVSGPLPLTGSEIDRNAALATLLIMLGVVLTWISRRRKDDEGAA